MLIIVYFVVVCIYLIYMHIYILAQSVIISEEVHADDSNLEREENVQSKV